MRGASSSSDPSGGVEMLRGTCTKVSYHTYIWNTAYVNIDLNIYKYTTVHITNTNINKHK